MRALVQRVSEAAVRVDGEILGEIGPGLLILVCAMQGDDDAKPKVLAEKLSKLRIFKDEAGKMNRSLADLGGETLVVSQFTLFADLRKGRRPSFFDAAPPEQAIPLLEIFCQNLVGTVRQGEFGAHMHVELVNDGPVTILLDTAMWTKINGR